MGDPSREVANLKAALKLMKKNHMAQTYAYVLLKVQLGRLQSAPAVGKEI